MKILHNIDNEKVTTLNDDAEFTNFMRKIAVENGDEDLPITCYGEAMDYLKNYCPNLTLMTYTQENMLNMLDGFIEHIETNEVQRNKLKILAIQYVEI